MAESLSSPGIELPSPMLSARLRELAGFLAAPIAGRLTEEQRALSLGIARRLVEDAARASDETIDTAMLWHDWLEGGLPTAARLAAACYTRAEEHRWRDHSAMRAIAPATDESSDSAVAVAAPEMPPKVDRAYLALQIADRRRFDARSHPRIALADADPDLLRALLRDIAAWRVHQPGTEGVSAFDPDDFVQRALDRHSPAAGIDRAARAYHASLGAALDVTAAAAAAIAAHDWPALIALAACEHRRSYADMAFALLSAAPAALPILLAPLRLDRAALAPLEASLAALPSRTDGEAGL
ncbi:hypothetical protein [Sphingopyxis sp.]|uniref:hypothetical protein n=1 Tax=Sphingopyxis sp. TaxID=1908224 RepID=UPI002622D64B|nr:hypothetical protein [Sphingopyxis sp.]MCW0198273.1 hypothetical protein [Sphingopyxis sp.]